MREFADKLHNGPNAWWGLSAALSYPLRERLGKLSQPAMVLRPKDEFWDASGQLREILSKARIVDLPNQGAGLIESAPDLVASAAREFLRD